MPHAAGTPARRGIRMAEAITYCDRCGKLVRPSEITDGSAVVGADAAVCAACVRLLDPEQQVALRSATGRSRAVGPSGAAMPGAAAEVRAEVAGREFGPGQAGGDWKRFDHEIEIKGRKTNTTLRLWIAAPGVRVWIDDVAAGPAE